jgi:hypothetical protein
VGANAWEGCACRGGWDKEPFKVGSQRLGLDKKRHVLRAWVISYVVFDVEKASRHRCRPVYAA